MSVRNQYGGAANGGVAKGTGLSGASTGVKITYTVPTGNQAVLTCCTVFPTAGAATIQIRVTISGTTCILTQGTVAMIFVGQVNLGAGDTVTVNVSVLDAAGVFDATISAAEFPAT